MTKAYQLEAIAKVTIVKYLTIVYAVAYSYFFFNESYNVYTYLGMLLVVTGILVNIAYTKKNE